MKPEFVIANVLPGTLNALVKNLMKQMGVKDPVEAVRLFNSGEWVVSLSVKKAQNWREEGGVIYFSVTSDGTTGPEWITRLEKRGFQLSNPAKSILLSPEFKATKGMVTEVAVLKATLFTDKERITKNIRVDAKKRGLTTPNAEVACLIREMFSDKELEAMGLWYIVVMHEPIKDSDGDPRLLGASRSVGGQWLFTFYAWPGSEWSDSGGFAFVASQVGPQT